MVLVYDHLLTFADEVELIWRQRPTVASAVFITNRMAALLIVVYSMLIDIGNVRHTSRIDYHNLTIFFRCESFGIRDQLGLNIPTAAAPDS